MVKRFHQEGDSSRSKRVRSVNGHDSRTERRDASSPFPAAPFNCPFKIRINYLRASRAAGRIQRAAKANGRASSSSSSSSSSSATKWRNCTPPRFVLDTKEEKCPPKTNERVHAAENKSALVEVTSSHLLTPPQCFGPLKRCRLQMGEVGCARTEKEMKKPTYGDDNKKTRTNNLTPTLQKKKKTANHPTNHESTDQSDDISNRQKS